MSNEPVGAGPEWYIGRIGLGLVYLASGMSHLPTLDLPITDHQNHIYYSHLDLQKTLPQTYVYRKR